MGWKDWPYWFIGGIIAIVISVAFVLFGTYNPMSLITYPTSSLFAVYAEGKISVGARRVLFFLSTVIMYFLIGAIIGWIIGKIKKTK